MSFFPSLEPLSTSPDADRYERSLQRAADGRSSGDSASWWLDDAAAFWLPGWQPPINKLASLPADGVMGLTTQAFLAIARDLPLVGPLFGSLNPYHGISAHSFCRAAHIAFAPAAKAIGEQLHGTGFRSLADSRLCRCHMADCKDSESLLGHCLPRSAFDAASRAGLLRPTRKMDVSPLTLLVTRLDCWRNSLPYISVRDREQHLKCLYCPYWVHDAMTNLATVVPGLLLEPELQLLVRAHVATSAKGLLKHMKNSCARERPHEHVYPPIRRTARSIDEIVTSTVDRIWHLTAGTFWPLRYSRD